MPSLLLHLNAVERLAAEPSLLPSEIAKALEEDIEYARFGAALSDLPEFDGFSGGFTRFLGPRGPSAWTQLLHGRAPVALGLKMAELVSMGALVGKEPGLAFVAGYFTHLSLDRVLHPAIDRLVASLRRPKESSLEAHARVEWVQALFSLREWYGRDLVGTPELRSRLQVLKRSGLPTRGVGGGLYEVVRLAVQETLNAQVTKREVDGWVRGLYLYSACLGSPVGRLRSLSMAAHRGASELYRGPEIDFPSILNQGLVEARSVLGKVAQLIRRGSFSPRSRERFFAEFPEGSIDSAAA